MEPTQLGALAQAAQQPKDSMNPQVLRWLMDMLAGKSSDPSWSGAGKGLPPQAVLNRPAMSTLPPGLGSVGDSGLGDKVGGVLEALQQRKKQQGAARDAAQ